MKGKIWKACLTGLCGLLAMGAAGSLATVSAAESFKFGVSKPGAAWYPIGTAAQRLAEKQYGDKVTLDIAGGLANTLNVLGGNMEFGITYATTVIDAFKERGAFKGKDAANLRLAAVNYPQLMFWVVWADSGITHWSQLKGKRVSAMPKAFAAQALNQQILTALGMSYNDFSKVLHLGFSDTVTQMIDGHIDAYLGPGEEVYAPIVQLAAHRPIRILSFSDEEIRKVRAIQPAVVPFTLNKKYYEQSGDVPIMKTFQVVVTNKNVPDGLVYKMAKIFYGNRDYFINVNKSFLQMDAKDVLQDMGIPRHPGLDKYLKEAGVL